MRSIDVITMALRSLFKRKLRTFLTILGVVIGTASIVVMISLGVGMNIQFQETLERAGNITVISFESEAFYNPSAPKGTPIIDDAILHEISGIENVEAVSPVVRGDFRVISGKYFASSGVYGIDLKLYTALGYKLDSGRIPEQSDINGVIMGGNVTENFYNPKQRNPYDNRITLDPYEDSFQVLVSDIQDSRKKYISKPQPITITGVTPIDSNNSYDIYMDIETVNSLNAEKKKVEEKYFKENNQKGRETLEGRGYSQGYAKCASIETVAQVQEQIREMGFIAWSQSDWINSMKQTSDSLQALLGAIGAVSLLVAAIGIANTMLMSIYERTKEIGVMKVIGATLSDIKKLFLFEAAVIGFFGGLFGLLLSFGLSYLLNNIGGLQFLSQFSWNPMDAETKMSVIPLWLCVLALAFSTVVGIVSGYLPARRAMKLSALAAIRAE